MASSLVILLTCTFSLVYSQPQVTTTLGTVAGKTIQFQENSYLGVNKKVDVYKGIPFAEPPIGEYRFEMPRPKERWQGVLNATEYSAWCLQPAFEPFLISDDCLYLNVFVPQTKPMNASVMVFIHGGAFSTGSAAVDSYSGIALAATGDVIVVTINYRLNLYGFITTGDDDYPGNVGLFDQLEALKWVNSNIAAFGGNPSRVTIFGESAGSASVDYHLLSKQSWSYFDQAILQSGTSLCYWAYANREDAKQLSIYIGKKVGCDYTDSKTFVKCLAAVDPHVIYNATIGMTVIPLPVVDGVFLENSPQMLIKNGDIKKEMALIIGTNKDEGTLIFLNDPTYYKQETPEISKSKFIDLIPKVFVPTEATSNPLILDSIYFEYTDWSLADDPEADYFQSGVDLSTDFQFLCPSDAVQRAHTNADNNVYVYVMSHAPQVSIFAPYGLDFPWIGAGHGEELQFVFGLPFLNDTMYLAEKPDIADHNVSVQFLRYWTNFAKTGDPNNSGSETLDPSFDEDLANWPTYNLPGLEYLNINSISSTERAYKADKCAFWNMYQPKLEQFTGDLSEAEEFWRNDYYSWKYNDLPEWQKAFDEYKQNKVCT